MNTQYNSDDASESSEYFVHVRPKSLAEFYPEEIAFFAKRFIWAANRKGFYTRSGYTKDEGWFPRKRCGVTWMPVYAKLASDLIEKHLDFERFCKIAKDNSPVRPRDNETAFWLGMMAGEYTYHDCIDVDSHDRVGFYGVPSRWHPDRNPNGGWADPYMYRKLPVMRIGLDYFKKLRLFHDHFPGRIWSFSSASLGMYLYRMTSKASCPHQRYEHVRGQLREFNMDRLCGSKVEVYPEPPKTPGSKGHQQRRPCGMDMGIITNRGVITDPIEQIRIFMDPETPTFESVFEAIITRLVQQYQSWIDFSDLTDKDEKLKLFHDQLVELESARQWLKDGCPNLESVQVQSVLDSSSLYSLSSPSPILCGVLSSVSEAIKTPKENPCEKKDDASASQDLDHSKDEDIFVNCDLETINQTRQWVPFVLFLAEHGFPDHDTFLPVISTLTRWLYYFELYEMKPEDRKARIKELLTTYCLNKHNGFITRLNNGEMDEVASNIGRLVEHTIETVNDQGKLVFLGMRSKRDRGRYQEVYSIEHLLTEESPSLSSPSSPILCGVSSEEGISDENWVYEPDDSPLPKDLERIIIEAFKASGYKMRKNKHGEFPILKAVTRLINYLAASPTYQRRASQQLLSLMGFPDQSKKREKIKWILFHHEILARSGYRRQKLSRTYFLTDRVIVFLVERKAVAIV